MEFVDDSFKENQSNFLYKLFDTVRFDKSIIKNKVTVFSSAIVGKEKPSDMLVLLFILVASVHVWCVLQLLQENDFPDVAAKPLMMEVSMMSIAVPKPSLEPPAAAPLPEPKKVIEPKKPKINKPVVKKKPVLVQQQAADFAPTEVVEVPKVNESDHPNSSIPSTHTTESDAAGATFTRASFNANYGYNPKPIYPPEARENGWEGKVKLKVHVNEEGLSAAVTVHHSSGYQILDEAAVTAVKKWRFIPAKRGDTPVASSVVVPLIFSLNDY